VARLLRPSGIGLASIYSLSRIAAVLKWLHMIKAAQYMVWRWRMVCGVNSNMF
jgi:hypothetical protein